MQLPANSVLREKIAHLLTRSSSNEVKGLYEDLA